MLQQTRVEVVRDYYARWVKTFPTVESLARAPFHRVLKLWEGLGYYTRARNLHRAAKVLDRRHRGSLPQTVDELRKLPGIGRYTAGAIASIAFDQAALLVDGNVARVFARVFGVRSDVTRPKTQKLFWTLATELLPTNDPGTFNQALMELGALICTPANPQCTTCPMHRVCFARAKGRQDELPVRVAKSAHKPVVQDVVLVRRGNRILLRHRPALGLLAGLWELPPLEKNLFRSRAPLLTLRHTITSKKITLRVFAGGGSSAPKSNGSLRWASAKDLTRLSLPAAHRRALEQIGRLR